MYEHNQLPRKRGDVFLLQRQINCALCGKAPLVLKNAKVVDVFTEELISADVAIVDDIVVGLGEYEGEEEIDLSGKFLIPGLIDAHVHIESSMASPARFAEVVLGKGTTTIIADPHEIANVCGSAGIQYMLDSTEDLPLRVMLMLPSCVPCTPFENNGMTLDAEALRQFVNHPRVLGLGEVMDYVSVLDGSKAILDKLSLFSGRMIDGHAPMLSGRALNAYRTAGPSTDHECSSYVEVIEKLRLGISVILRVGSAANDVSELLNRLLHIPTDNVCFCTDDKHLEDIQEQGHINYILRRAVECGFSPAKAVKLATLNVARIYGLRGLGAIAPGYKADIAIVDSLDLFDVSGVICSGKLISAQELPQTTPPIEVLESVKTVLPEAFDIPVAGRTPVVALVEGQLVTKLIEIVDMHSKDGKFVPYGDFAKVAVIERHHATGNVGLGIVKGFNVEGGAVASTVAHDSHNMVIVGDNDSDMLLAAQTLQECGGGYCVVSRGKVKALLNLRIAGLMTDAPTEEILETQKALLREARALGFSGQSDPFVMISFLALPVIPEVRITDMGLFDVVNHRFIIKQ